MRRPAAGECQGFGGRVRGPQNGRRRARGRWKAESETKYETAEGDRERTGRERETERGGKRKGGKGRGGGETLVVVRS